MATDRGRTASLRARADERLGGSGVAGDLRNVYRRDQAAAGGELAGALAYRLFLWFLPFILVLVAGLGVYADAQGQEPEEAASWLGLAGLVVTSVAEAAQSSARWYALAFGLPVVLYMTRNLLRTVAAVHRLAWGLEPRRGYVTPANVLLFLGMLAAFVVVGVGISASTTRSGWAWLAAAPVSVVVRGGLWLAISLRLPRRPCPWTALLPGALVVGAGLLATNSFTTLAIGEIAASRKDTYGALGVATAILFSLWLTSRVVVLSAVASAALWLRGTDTIDKASTRER